MRHGEMAKPRTLGRDRRGIEPDPQRARRGEKRLARLHRGAAQPLDGHQRVDAGEPVAKRGPGGAEPARQRQPVEAMPAPLQFRQHPVRQAVAVDPAIGQRAFQPPGKGEDAAWKAAVGELHRPHQRQHARLRAHPMSNRASGARSRSRSR
ncbi:hypothetical protein SDC9_35794 [bioreactor metagenome]|uniref:Uncharacterized protein n=1 Tax=bioreactor metagenome TaxID=1076179 RepID=A0A644VGF7_9ZZZZ